jgi:mannose-6-phosphate isomerase-like protein (cupin superfamily)
MCTTAVFFAGDKPLFVANDGADLRYYASIEYLPPGYETGARSPADREVIFVVQAGTVEFMVDGASQFVAAGALVRVRGGAHFAYRNPGNEAACLLVRAARPCDRQKMMRVTMEFAA